jgi:hypothetical protein
MYLICVKQPVYTFPLESGLKQGEALTPLFNMPLGVPSKPGGLEFNGTHQFLVCPDDDNLLAKELC